MTLPIENTNGWKNVFHHIQKESIFCFNELIKASFQNPSDGRKGKD